MNDFIFCSVIIPVYRAEPYISRCVNSMLAQSYGNFELLLVDDGSPDKSGEICDQLAKTDSRVRVIHKENGGHTSARNVGLSVANGVYVAFVDSDDWVEPTLIEDCWSVASKYHPEIILYGYRRVGMGLDKDKPQPYEAGYYNRERIENELLPSLLTSGRFSLSERMMKREVVCRQQFSINSAIVLGEDLACCVCAVGNADSVYILDNIYYNYLQHEGSVAHSYQNYSFEDWTLLKDHLDSRLADLVPDYERQMSVCSIRFLHRAVLGEFMRKGWSPRTVHMLSEKLKAVYSQSNLKFSRERDFGITHSFKAFCLQHRFLTMLFVSDRLMTTLRRIKGR